MDISLLDPLTSALERGEGVVLALVLATKGSSPRKAGAALLATESGRMAGTVGGGLVEASTLAEAARIFGTGGASLLTLRLDGVKVAESVPICGGEVEVLILNVTNAAPYIAARAEIELGRPVVTVYAPAEASSYSLAAIFDEKGRALWGSADCEAAAFGSALRGQTLRGSDGRYYDPLLPAERLLILGGGHVGKALARIAFGAGFSVTVADPRPEYSDPAAHIPGIAVLRDSFEEAVRKFSPRPIDYAVVVSPGHQGDLSAIRSLLAFELKYLGFIGSRRKTTMAIEQLLSEGFDATRVEGLCAPIGLDIGAETPEEIAIAICAELIAYRRGGACLSYLQEERRERRSRPYA
jgi:xanthine dehydrogenase accessory factor